MRKAMDQPGLGIGWKDDKRLRLSDLDFADDIALVAEQAHVCQQMTANLATHSVKRGLHISLEKTKIIQASQAATSQPIYLGQTESECVDRFTYLGSVISKDGDVEKEVNNRLAKAATVFRKLSNIWKFCSLGIKRRSTSTYWTDTTAGHRRGKQIPVCGSCHADGTRTPSPPRN